MEAAAGSLTQLFFSVCKGRNPLFFLESLRKGESIIISAGVCDSMYGILCKDQQFAGFRYSIVHEIILNGGAHGMAE